MHPNAFDSIMHRKSPVSRFSRRDVPTSLTRSLRRWSMNWADKLDAFLSKKSRGKSLKSVLKNSVTLTHIATYNQNYSSLYSIDRRSLRDTIMVMYLIYFAKWMKSTSTQSIIRFHIITLLECFSTVLRLFPAENNNVHFSGYWLSYVWQVVEGSFFQLFWKFYA